MLPADHIQCIVYNENQDAYLQIFKMPLRQSVDLFVCVADTNTVHSCFHFTLLPKEHSQSWTWELSTNLIRPTEQSVKQMRPNVISVGVCGTTRISFKV